MKRPSPSMAVALLALFIALGGSAVAARTLITSSSQIKAGAVSGSDLRNGSITASKLKNGSVTDGKLAASVRSTLRGTGFTAQEAVRRTGPTNQAPGQRQVATITQLAPGTYAILAKTTLSAGTESEGLNELLRSDKSGSGHCILDVGGDVDDAREAIANPGTRQPSTVNLQMTRTIDQPTDVKLICDSNIPWSANDTSIIALKLTGSSRSDVTG